MENQSFLKIAGIACIISAVTTVGIHFVSFPAETFDDRLKLPGNPIYIAHRWMIIVHCLCVIVSMLGIALMKRKEGQGWIALGFLFYTVFGITEISRMMAVLHDLNPMRMAYVQATDEATKNFLRYSIDHFNHVGITLFSIFALAFSIANLSYGIVFVSADDKSKWLGYGLLYWAAVGFIAIANESLHVTFFEHWIEIHNKIFQPLFRLTLGIWILNNISQYRLKDQN